MLGYVDYGMIIFVQLPNMGDTSTLLDPDVVQQLIMGAKNPEDQGPSGR